MLGPLLIVAAFASPAIEPQNAALNCMVRETNRLASDPKQAAEFRRWTRWEATRLLWSLAGDSAKCAQAFRVLRPTDETSNAAYRHADHLVVRKHLYRD